MIRKSTLICCIIMVLLIAGISSFAADNNTEIYVSSVSGDDAGNGSIGNPFRTAERAKEYVRTINSDMKGDITVFFREGVYTFDDTLKFDERDSGSNGYYITYKAYGDENVKFSGGKKVENWQKYNDKIWYVDWDETEYVRQLYVNDRRARRAQSEELYAIKSIYSDKDDTYKYDGVITQENKFLKYKNKQDIQIHIAIGWKSFLINVEDIIPKNNGSIFLLHRKSFMSACTCAQHYIEPGIQFYVENAFEELDREGEFYYDRQSKKLYYMPRADEDMTTAEVYLASVEKLVDIKGENSNSRVHNINFDGITFAHVAWNRPSKVGLINDQAQMMTPDDEVDIPKDPGFSMVPANISLERTEKVNFKNCVFKDMGAVALGFVRGCIDSYLTGNVFCDVADSAITAGVIGEMYNDKVYEGQNLACGKPVTASSYLGSGFPLNAVDNDTFSVWAPKDGACWLQIDLEKEYEIDRIEIDPRKNMGADGVIQGIDILASNDPDFKTYSVLGSTSSSSYRDKDNTLILHTDNSGKYRYVRLKKNSYMALASVRIINESMPYAPSTELCRNIKIDNNYITRIGLVNFGAPAIQGYYNQNLNVSHNEMYYIPYSGVCSGWGWTLYGLTDCRDIKINYNRIDSSMLVQFDGGAIYTLGKQPNSVQVGNYITNQVNDLAAIYYDNGTSFFTSRENVLDGIPSSYHCAGGEGNLWIDNHTTSIADSLNFTYQTNSYAGRENEIFASNTPNTQILGIMQNAGLEKGYEGIKSKAGENLWPWSRYEMTQNVEVHGGYGSEDSKAAWVAKYYIRNHIDSIKRWLPMLELGEEVGMYPVSAKEGLENVIAEAEALLTSGKMTRASVPEMYWKIYDALDEFKNSRNHFTGDELEANAEKLLNNTVIGGKNGNISQENHDKLLEHKNEYTRDKTENNAKMLEAAIVEFRNNIINFNIKSFTIANQKGNVEIDTENSVIHAEVFANADLSKLTAAAISGEGTYIDPDLSKEQDYSEPFKLYVTSLDGSEKKEWTVNITKEKEYSSDEIFSLNESIADSNGWNIFGSYNNKYYENKRFKDITLDFNMMIEEKRSGDWPCLVFRSQNNAETFDSKNNEAYVLVFSGNGIEFYRFNNGKRTQLYGNIGSLPQLFGPKLQTEAFKFGEKNKMQLTCKNTENGVRMALTINGTSIFDVVDNFDGNIQQSGYFGSVSPGAEVQLLTD